MLQWLKSFVRPLEFIRTLFLVEITKRSKQHKSTSLKPSSPLLQLSHMPTLHQQIAREDTGPQKDHQVRHHLCKGVFQLQRTRVQARSKMFDYDFVISYCPSGYRELYGWARVLINPFRPEHLPQQTVAWVVLDPLTDSHTMAMGDIGPNNVKRVGHVGRDVDLTSLS